MPPKQKRIDAQNKSKLSLYRQTMEAIMKSYGVDSWYDVPDAGKQSLRTAYPGMERHEPGQGALSAIGDWAGGVVDSIGETFTELDEATASGQYQKYKAEKAAKKEPPVTTTTAAPVTYSQPAAAVNLPVEEEITPVVTPPKRITGTTKKTSQGATNVTVPKVEPIPQADTPSTTSDPTFDYLGIDVPGYTPPTAMEKYNKAMGVDFNFEDEANVPERFGTDSYVEPSVMKSLTIDNIAPTDAELAKSAATDMPKSSITGDADVDAGDMATGDKIALIAGGVQELTQSGITLYQRLTDEKRENPFARYGERALKKIGEAKSFARKQFDESYRDIDLASGTARRNLRTMSRGVGGLRAGELGVHMQETGMKRQARGDYYGRMGEIIGKEAAMLTDQDLKRMTGAQQADELNRADKDAFYSALSSNAASMGEYFQQTGKNMNQAQQNREMEGLIGEMSKYGYHYDRKTGKMTYNG